jgi:hypothetical protein
MPRGGHVSVAFLDVRHVVTLAINLDPLVQYVKRQHTHHGNHHPAELWQFPSEHQALTFAPTQPAEGGLLPAWLSASLGL